MSNNKIFCKWLINAAIENKTPIIIGTGKNSGLIDIEVIKDEQGNFYIPGTSFKGALRHFLEDYYNIPNKDILDLFFGSQGQQSLATFFDLKADKKTVIKVRDGVAIDIKTNIAKKGAKYDYEIVEPGHSFSLNIEINLYSHHIEYKQELLKLLATIKQVLENQDEKFVVGAMTTKGFGIVKSSSFKVYEFDFEKDQKAKHEWFKYLINEDNYLPADEKEVNIADSYQLQNKNDFSISATFNIKSSLLIGASPGPNEEADKVPLKSNGKPVLSGTSLKGVIRSRAIRIINTLNGNGEELIKETFGWADTENKKSKKIKSRLIVKETIIENAIEKLKNGIKINRFTAGTIDSALFNAVLLWSKGQDAVHIKLHLKNPQNWEKGLLLLILKDLWTADLPIGADKARGAGVLLGSKAEIKDGSETLTLEQKDGHLQITGDKNKFESYVTDFLKFLNN